MLPANETWMGIGHAGSDELCPGLGANVNSQGVRLFLFTDPLIATSKSNKKDGLGKFNRYQISLAT